MPAETPPRRRPMRRFRDHVTQDWAANRGLPKSLLVLTCFRTASWLEGRRTGVGAVAYAPTAAIYKLLSEWLLGVEIPIRTSIGPRLRLRHGVGVVINPAAVLGSDVVLRHGVTIGNRSSQQRDECPVIGDGVEFGANSTVVGPVRVGDGATIGAGAVVSENVPAGGLARAAAARISPVRSEPSAEPEQRGHRA